MGRAFARSVMILALWAAPAPGLGAAGNESRLGFGAYASKVSCLEVLAQGPNDPTLDPWRPFCVAASKVLQGGQAHAVGRWVDPAEAAVSVYRKDRILRHVEIDLGTDEIAARIAFNDVDISIDGIGDIIVAADLKVPDEYRTIEIKLPGVFPDVCPERGPDLADQEIKRAFVLLFPGVARDGYRRSACEPDGSAEISGPPLTTPALFVRAVKFKSSTRWVLPQRLPISLSFTATTFEGPIEILGAPPEPNATAAPVPAAEMGKTYIVFSASSLQSDLYVSGINLNAFVAYFNRMESMTLSDVEISDRLQINDNRTGPVRIREINRPAEFILDANDVNDSLYIENVGWTGSPIEDQPAKLWFVAHNKISGNLKFSLVDDRPRGGAAEPGSSDREALRFTGMVIDGSAYILLEKPLFELPPLLDIDVTHTTIGSRLLVTAAERQVRGDASHAGSDVIFSALAPRDLEATCRSSHRSANDSGLRVNLTGSTAGALVWNLPIGQAAAARCIGWNGPSFRARTVDPKAVQGPLLVQAGVSDWSQEVARIGAFPQAQTEPSPEAFGVTEKYFLERGFLFEALEMKGEKTFENLKRKTVIAWGELGSDRWLGAAIKLMVLCVLWLYYLPAWFGAAPEYALLGLVAVYLLATLFYVRHIRLWAADDWQGYRKARGLSRRPYLSETPGFEQKDEHPWRRFRVWLYALDSMIPLVHLGVADEYQPHVGDNGKGSHITILPPAQKVLGTWLGSLCLVIFLF